MLFIAESWMTWFFFFFHLLHYILCSLVLTREYKILYTHKHLFLSALASSSQLHRCCLGILCTESFYFSFRLDLVLLSFMIFSIVFWNNTFPRSFLRTNSGTANFFETLTIWKCLSSYFLDSVFRYYMFVSKYLGGNGFTFRVLKAFIYCSLIYSNIAFELFNPRQSHCLWTHYHSLSSCLLAS
jgi:hypothetical protein